MSVQTEIDRIITAVQAAHEKVLAKGGTTAQPYLVGNLAGAIDTIPTGSDPVLQTKTVTPTTAKQTIKPDSGYDGLSQVDVNAMPTATQATPSISVSSAGVITASATQSAGYVASGTKSATKQLTTQAAKTITPSTSQQTAVASGRYTTGAVTVAPIPSSYVQPSGTLDVTENGTHDVKNYESVNVNVASSGGGSDGGSVETCTVTIQANYRTYVFLTVYSNGYITVESVPVDAGNVVTVENVVKNSMMACIFVYYPNARYELYSYQPVNINNVDIGINWAMFKVWDNGDGDNCSCYLTWEKC